MSSSHWCVAVLLAVETLCAQKAQDPRFQAAGVCARCHVVSVLEWGASRHFRAGTGCVECHGASVRHVADERNNVKPDRIPRDAAATAKLCLMCHAAGCPKTQRKDACGTCHHVHALVNAERPADVRDAEWEARAESWKRAKALAREGESFMAGKQWAEALAKLNESLAIHPRQPEVMQRIQVCRRRMHPEMPGFVIAGAQFDAKTGLPLKVMAKELEIEFALVPGGRQEIGAERLAASMPVHTVMVEPFYMAVHEVTQAEWTAWTGKNASRFQGAKYPNAARQPVENVSWSDCQLAIAGINQRVPGGGFRLPTEVEWEAAARDGGESAQDAFNLAAPRVVEAGLPNRFGVYDLRGNVWEWCSSLALPYPYSVKDGREDPDSKRLRVLRGGGFADGATWFDPSARFAERPERRLPVNGVRLVRSVPE